MISRKKKIRRKKYLASSQTALLIKPESRLSISAAAEHAGGKIIGEEVSQNMEREHIYYQKGGQGGEIKMPAPGPALYEDQSQSREAKISDKAEPKISEKADQTLNIRESRIADSLLMQLEDEVIGFINRRLEEHVVKRIKGLLVPVAKLSLKVRKLRKTLSDEAAEYLTDLEDDLDYILENSKVERISPQVGEKFDPSLHEEVDFAWDPDQEEAKILATVRDGFFWEYNREMIIKPQVVVNRRLLA